MVMIALARDMENMMI